MQRSGILNEECCNVTCDSANEVKKKYSDCITLINCIKMMKDLSTTAKDVFSFAGLVQDETYLRAENLKRKHRRHDSCMQEEFDHWVVLILLLLAFDSASKYFFC